MMIDEDVEIIQANSIALNQMDNEFEHIILTEEEKQRIYKPWTYSVIVKLLGKRISYEYLKNKLTYGKLQRRSTL